MAGEKQWDDPRFLNLYVLADLVNQPIHITTPDGIVRFVNKSWCLVYDRTLDEAVGRHIHDLLESEHLNFYMSFDEGISEDPTNLTYQYFTEPSYRSAATQAVQRRRRITCLSHTPNFSQMLVTATPIFDDGGEIVCVVTLIQNLTMLGHWRDYIEREAHKNAVLQQEIQYLRSSQSNSSLVGSSRAMGELRKLISVVAPSDASVLISGESGVGKEVVAREIYAESHRSDKPFTTVNCAAIPENLLESELFGHEKGSFTGALSTKIGLFEVSNGGTIFLDEIGEFPLHLQPKLLRVLQERKFRRVGGTKELPMDVRVIAATNRDLLEMTRAGTFRMDLYYRLNVFPIHIPALRQRKDDISLLAASFLKRFNEKYECSKFFCSQALLELERYPWPGNVRELENLVERLVVIADRDAITSEQVSALLNGTDGGSDSGFRNMSLKDAVAGLERQMISEALKTCGTTYKAAKALGTTQSTIVRKAQALGITDW